MLFGYKPERGSADLMTDMMKLSLDIGNFRREKIGPHGTGKNAPITMTLSSFSLLKSGSKLLKPMKIEKCAAYRNKNE